jgi:hypothetical protein
VTTSGDAADSDMMTSFLAAAMSIRNGAREAIQNMLDLPTQRKW